VDLAGVHKRAAPIRRGVNLRSSTYRTACT
jgi:hypothetical protein